MKKYLALSLTALSLAQISCSSSNVENSSTVAGAGFSRAQTSLAGIASLAPAPVTPVPFYSADLGARGVGFSTHWPTNIGLSDQRYVGNPPISIKDWMGIEFQDGAYRPDGSPINVFGRMESGQAIPCIVANSLSAPTSASLVGTGPATITFTASLKATLTTACGFQAADLADFPASATLTFEAASPSTTFDLKATIDIEGTIETMYFKWGSSDGIVAYASAEDNTTTRSRTVVVYDTSSRLLKVEYLFKSKENGYSMVIHRLWKDDVTGAARVYTVTDSIFSSAVDTSADYSIHYIVDGNVGSTFPSLSVSMYLNGWNGGAADGNFEACVLKTDGSSADQAAASNAFACTGTGGTGGRDIPYTTGVSGPSATFNTASTLVTPTWQSFTTAPSITWTSMDEMLTTGI